MLKKLTPYHYALLSQRLTEYHYTWKTDGTHPLREGAPALDRWIMHLNLTHEESPIGSISDILRAAENPSSWDDDSELSKLKDPMIFLLKRLKESHTAGARPWPLTGHFP